MRIVYLESALPGLTWLREYYTHVFPQGAQKAYEQRKKAEGVLLLHPHAGTAIADVDNVRKFTITKTPFSLVYRVQPDRIEIISVIDERAENI